MMKFKLDDKVRIVNVGASNDPELKKINDATCLIKGVAFDFPEGRHYIVECSVVLKNGFTNFVMIEHCLEKTNEPH